MIVRRGTPADAAELSRLAARLFEQTYAHSVPRGELEDHLASDFSAAKQEGELEDQDIATLIVVGDSGLVGFAQLRRAELPVAAAKPANVELWRIYVDSQHHGSGMGRTLLAAAGEEARAFGATGVWLGVWEQNPRAIAFYTKHGFDVVGAHNFTVGAEVQTDLIMRAAPHAF